MTNGGCWTLYFDESGSFDGTERGGLVVGGVLCPGSSPAIIDEQEFRRECGRARVDWPPHANKIEPATRAGLLAMMEAKVTAAGGTWLFVASRPALKVENAILAYLQMVGTLVDLAVRFVALREGKQLVVVAAQRTTPMSGEPQAEAARRRGLGRVSGEGREPGALLFQAWIEGEVRQVFDALTREESGSLPGFPALAEVAVISASYAKVDQGILIADFGCNAVYRTLAKPDEPPSFREEGFFIIDRNDAAAVRRIDRCMREVPADLHGAARSLKSLEARARSAQASTLSVAAAPGFMTATEVWERSKEVLARSKPDLVRVLHKLGSAALYSLAEKGGAYEGTWAALKAAWAGDGSLARSARECAGSERELSARMWRCVLECANHRGDVASAVRAAEEFERIYEAGHSLWLMAENLAVRNFVAVAAQNRLPAPQEEIAALSVELLESAEELKEAALEAGELVALAESRRGDPVRAPVPADEDAFWQLTGKVRPTVAPDRERGSLLGTAARSLAFTGDIAGAFALAMEARALFDTPFDRRFNASVICRILLEAAREGDDTRQEVLSRALELAGASIEPADSTKLVAKGDAERFALDLALRAALWAPGAVRTKGSWRKALAEVGPKSLLAQLETRRTHPTELIARHAGELLRAAGDDAAAGRWFALSVTLSEEAPPGSAIERFGAFTRRLADGQGRDGAAPFGSIENPSFEYR